MMRGPALGNGAPEQPLGRGHGEQRADTHRSRRLAEDRDIARITAKGSDILAHPVEGGDLVEQATVGVSRAEIQETLGANPIIDRHTDDAVTGKVATIIPG